MLLEREDVLRLRTGAIFNACAADHEWCAESADRVLAHMRATGSQPELVSVEDFDDGDLIVALGIVNNGLSLADLRPVGDEFTAVISLIEDTLDEPVAGLMPLAAGSTNALIPLLAGMQAGLPVADADPMGRILPKVNQTVLTLAGLPAGPVAAAGPLGERAVVHVEDPGRTERLLRCLAGEFGGWTASASYPIRASVLARTGVTGSLSRLLRIGQILDSGTPVAQKHRELREAGGVQQILRAHVHNSPWTACCEHSAPTSAPATTTAPEATSAAAAAARLHAQPPRAIGTPASVVLIDEERQRLMQLEVCSEILMLIVEGAVRAAVPDIISLLRPEDASVAGLEDLWQGHVVDIVISRAAEAWYSAEGLRLAGPEAFGMTALKSP